MFPQQSPELMEKLQTFKVDYDDESGKDVVFAPHNYSIHNNDRYPTSYPLQTINSVHNDMKTYTTPDDCNLMQQMLPPHLYSMPFNQMTYPPLTYNPYATPYQFQNCAPDPNNIYKSFEDVHLLQKMKMLSYPESLESAQGYPLMNMSEYNPMRFSMQYPKYGGNGNGKEECVKCGMVTGRLCHQDTNGHFLCFNCCCARSSFLSLPTDMTQLQKHSNSSKTTSRNQSSKRSGVVCSNCGSDQTTLWRRNTEGKTVCNACGLYYRLHKKARPPTMKKETLQTRKRKSKKGNNSDPKCLKSDQVHSLSPRMLTSQIQRPPWL